MTWPMLPRPHGNGEPIGTGPAISSVTELGYRSLTDDIAVKRGGVVPPRATVLIAFADPRFDVEQPRMRP
jgi:hypothetical protein